MDRQEFLARNFNIDKDIVELAQRAEEGISGQFKRIEEIAQINQWKVLKAFADNHVSEAHFTSTTGYGYDDLGRDTLERVVAQIFGAEDALIRHNFVSGTHTISTALFAILRPGDLFVAVTGKPYDTLEEVIGIAGQPGRGSLKDYGVDYKQIDLNSQGRPDYDAIKEVLMNNKVKMIEIQRSKGYAVRPTYSAEEIGGLIKFIKNISPETVCFVDNCYGEFVDLCEPTDFGADLIAGSLIKNAGGGIAPTGGYIAGKKELIELCAYRLTSVGVGREGGASLGTNRYLYQGMFMAPHTVSQALKSSIFCAALFKLMGFEVEPEPEEERHDIIQAIKLENAENLISFCCGIQQGAPVDAFVEPKPWNMPGYQDPVIMAAGAFVQGASIELSADGPLREPYAAYMQGGLTYESAKLGIMIAAQKMKNNMNK